MSTVLNNEWRGPQTNNHCITMPPGTCINAPGQVLQTVWRRMDYPTTYSLPPGTSSNGSEFAGLELTITKKDPNSYVYCQWWVFYETHHDVVFRVFRDGSLVGYNLNQGITAYSGISAAEYEHSFDNASTPSVLHLSYWDRVVTSSPIRYCLGGTGGTTSYNIMLNMPTNTGSTDGYERGVSWAMLEEISFF